MKGYIDLNSPQKNLVYCLSCFYLLKLFVFFFVSLLYFFYLCFLNRYDQYRHVQPPRQLPRDWDDIRVRHKYYTDRGYFGHDMTLEELSRWEAWWHRYQLWRRGYEHAWVKTHGPHVPIEYPDWTNYRSTNSRREVAQPVSTSSSIRSRLGWRR